MNMYSSVVGLLALLLTVGAATDQAQLTWKSAPEAFTEAKSSGKKVLLDVYTDWCGWCKRMDKATYADSAVIRYLNAKFVAAKMNPEKAGNVTFKGKEYSQREFGQVLGISGYPATAFFDEEGEVLTVVPGYAGPQDFMKVLRYIGEDIYKTTSWEEYTKSNR